MGTEVQGSSKGVYYIHSYVEKELKKLADDKEETPRASCGRSGFLLSLGIAVPQLRSLVDRVWVAENPQQRLELWSFIYFQSPYLEMMSLAIYHYQRRELSLEEQMVIKGWVERCGCWQHSDELSKIYVKLVEKHPKRWYPVLEEWKDSCNPWKRRQSLVSLLEYARMRSRVLPYEKMICFIEHLRDDPDYYVQKAVGWTLRELYTVYPEKTLAYMKENIVLIHSQAYAAAVEKLPQKLRVEFREQRKAYRSQK